METEFKPCPHCGSEDIKYVNRVVFGEFGEYIERFVICDNCYSKTGGYKNMQETIKAWNRRSTEND